MLCDHHNNNIHSLHKDIAHCTSCIFCACIKFAKIRCTSPQNREMFSRKDSCIKWRRIVTDLEAQYCTFTALKARLSCTLYTLAFLVFEGKATSPLLERKVISHEFLNPILLYSSRMHFSTNSSFSRTQHSTPTWMLKNNSHSAVLTTVSLSLLLSTPIHTAADRCTFRCNKNDPNFRSFPFTSVRLRNNLTDGLSCLVISKAFVFITLPFYFV